MVPESEDAESLFPKPFLSINIGQAPCMLSTIDFDDERSLKTNEVDDIRSQRVLAAKFDPEGASPDDIPKLHFGIGHGIAEETGIQGTNWNHPPYVPPSRGEKACSPPLGWR